MKKCLNVFLGLAVLFILAAVPAFGLEIITQGGGKDLYGVYQRHYIDKSVVPYERTSVFIKIVLKPIPGFAYNSRVTDLYFHLIDRSMARHSWHPVDFFTEYGRFASFDDWLAWAENLSEDVIVEPDVGMNFQLKQNLILRTYVNVCGTDRLWNTLKYRAGGHFIRKGEGREPLEFSNENALDDYFLKIVEKLDGCIQNRFPHLEELKKIR